LIFAHLARWAAAIVRRPAADIVRFGFGARLSAHRRLCAAAIFLRLAAEIVRFEMALPSAAKAASIRARN
jgi:hypothetical protein